MPFSKSRPVILALFPVSPRKVFSEKADAPAKPAFHPRILPVLHLIYSEPHREWTTT